MQGCGVWDAGLRGLGFRVAGSGVQGCGVQGSGLRGLGCRVKWVRYPSSSESGSSVFIHLEMPVLPAMAGSSSEEEESDDADLERSYLRLID